MSTQAEKIIDIQLKLVEIKQQVDRLISDAESEKDTRKRRNEDLEKRIRALEEWKSELHGRIVVTVAIATLIWGALIAVILKFIK